MIQHIAYSAEKHLEGFSVPWMQFVFSVSQAIQAFTRSLITLVSSHFIVMCHAGCIQTSSQEMCIDLNGALKALTAFFVYWHMLAFACCFVVLHFWGISFFEETACCFEAFQWALCVMGGLSLTHIQQLSSLNSWWVWNPHTSQSSITLLHVPAPLYLFNATDICETVTD